MKNIFIIGAIFALASCRSVSTDQSGVSDQADSAVPSPPYIMNVSGQTADALYNAIPGNEVDGVKKIDGYVSMSCYESDDQGPVGLPIPNGIRVPIDPPVAVGLPMPNGIRVPIDPPVAVGLPMPNGIRVPIDPPIAVGIRVPPRAYSCTVMNTAPIINGIVQPAIQIQGPVAQEVFNKFSVDSTISRSTVSKFHKSDDAVFTCIKGPSQTECYYKDNAATVDPLPPRMGMPAPTERTFFQIEGASASELYNEFQASQPQLGSGVKVHNGYFNMICSRFGSGSSLPPGTVGMVSPASYSCSAYTRRPITNGIMTPAFSTDGDLAGIMMNAMAVEVSQSNSNRSFKEIKEENVEFKCSNFPAGPVCTGKILYH